MRNARGFNVWPEVYFSGSENVTEFLEGIDNQIKLLEIPSDLSCAYLKGHLLGRALDWNQIFGSALVQNTATDFAQLKALLSKDEVIIEEIGEILKRCVDLIMVEMIMGVTMRIAVKEISGPRAGIGFKTMIEDLTIGDINSEIEVKMTVLVEGTKEIGVRVKILVEAIEDK
ncbi:uncharacterized protein TNCV_663421 [Trichonephila clavipes]|nr:uncharacterized protein TNCV_663421 [Trichonephila clavipes]